MPPERSFLELVSIACHDLRTPLATVYGFVRTLERLDLEAPAREYTKIIREASEQMRDLLDQLAIMERIESGGYAPKLVEVDSLALAREAAEDLGEGRVLVSGEGAAVRVVPEATRRALAQLARAAARHGGQDSVNLEVHGSELQLFPLTRASTPVLLGEDVRELGAPAAGVLIRFLGGSLEARDERLLIRLPVA
jgi:signal transduction histidine kinase